MERRLKMPYLIKLDVKFPALSLIDVGAEAAACTEPWFNQTLTQVNNCVVRLGVLHGEFHWHKHNFEDEFFYVVEGRLFVDLEKRSIELTSGQGITVPHGVMHRTRSPERTVVLMFEGAEITPTGD